VKAGATLKGNKMDFNYDFGKNELYKALKSARVTIRKLSAYMDIPLSRIREVNAHGITGAAGFDYWEAVQVLSLKK